MNPNLFLSEFNKAEPRLYGFAMKMTRNTNDATDLLQETLVTGLAKIHLFKEGSNLPAWLSTIMRNLFINEYRKRRVRNVIDESAEDYLMRSGHTAADEADKDVQMKELSGLLDQLSPSIRETFELFYEGFQYEEIAKETGVPVGTVKSRIFGARKQLKKIYRKNFA